MVNPVSLTCWLSHAHAFSCSKVSDTFCEELDTKRQLKRQRLVDGLDILLIQKEWSNGRRRLCIRQLMQTLKDVLAGAHSWSVANVHI